MSPRSERFQASLESVADSVAVRLGRAWALAGVSSDLEGSWMAAARPMVQASAVRSVALSGAYASLVAPGASLPAVSSLVVPNAVAHTWEPLTVVWRGLGEGLTFAEAHAAAVDSVVSVADEAVMQTGRDAVADRLAGRRVQWMRQLNAGACKWCLSMAKYRWSAAHEATFGHSRCRCVAVPDDEIGDHNQKVMDDAGWDAQAERQYAKRHQIARLKESELNARRRSQEAAEQLRTETDPLRRERLSMREQDWETRAERAAEKRRILETGSHLIAA